jgi:hypothetical protein
MHNQSSHQDEEINEDTFDEDLSKKNDKKIRRTSKKLKLTKVCFLSG